VMEALHAEAGVHDLHAETPIGRPLDPAMRARRVCGRPE